MSSSEDEKELNINILRNNIIRRSSSKKESPIKLIINTSTNNSDNDDDNDNNNISKPELFPNCDQSSSKVTGWKKLLWLKQPYPDNYTDASFLSQLKRNSTVVQYSYTKLVYDFSLVVLHLSLIMSVIVVFYGIYQLNWNPIKPLILSTTMTIIGFIYYTVTLNIRRNKELIELQQFKIKQLYNIPTTPNLLLVPNLKINESDILNMEEYLTEPSPPNFYETCKSSLLIILYILTLTPVLKSLTNSTSSDSIWALSGWLSILNILFNDYQIEFPKLSIKEKRLHWQKLLINNYQNKLFQTPFNSRSPSPVPSRINSSINLNTSNSNNQQELKPIFHNNIKLNELFNQQIKNSNISKNIAVSNAIVLASRLNSNISAFSFILFAIQLCGLFPTFNNFTRRCKLNEFHLLQMILIIVTVDTLVCKLFGYGWFITWISLHFMIIIIGPWYFLTLQKYKNELQGPWDIAKPVVNSKF